VPSEPPNALSIEAFAESIAASLAATAPPAAAAAAPGEPLSFRERVRRRVGSADLLVFRIAGELFAVELVAVEEALDMPVVHRLPEMPAPMLGVFTLRGTLVSVFEPRAALGIPFHEATTILVFAGGDRRVALAADDVDDVLTADLRTVRDVPGGGAAEDSLLGVVRRGRDLIALLDAATLVAAHRTLAAALPEGAKETA
jgi:purine-binding chemotaxis protein CheW